VQRLPSSLRARRSQPLLACSPLAGKLLTSDAFPGNDRTKLCMVSKARATLRRLGRR